MYLNENEICLYRKEITSEVDMYFKFNQIDLKL